MGGDGRRWEEMGGDGRISSVLFLTVDTDHRSGLHKMEGGGAYKTRTALKVRKGGKGLLSLGGENGKRVI